MSAPSEQFLNISVYKFTPFETDELPALRERLHTAATAGALRGTILLSTEGINIFVAGTTENVHAFVDVLRSVRGLADLTPKESFSDEQPFNRMLVKIKKEIIAFGIDGIDPSRNPSPKLSPRTLKQWLDEGRPITLLDTRNDYEVHMGTFRGAVAVGVDNFRQFPAAVANLPADLKTQPVVMFCTGGIRCEKAGPFMEREGYENVFQLDGGILKYFEECGGDHYDGECFVFDRRVGVNAELKETGSVMCWVCQMPISVEMQKDPRYIADKSCPYCVKV